MRLIQKKKEKKNKERAEDNTAEQALTTLNNTQKCHVPIGIQYASGRNHWLHHSKLMLLTDLSL
jgi:hypothetical protein